MAAAARRRFVSESGILVSKLKCRLSVIYINISRYRKPAQQKLIYIKNGVAG
jgi:hypothetical protein